jgi:hypothetical protein
MILGGGGVLVKDKTTKTWVNELPLICGSWAPIFWGLVTDSLEGGKAKLLLLY